MKKLLYYLPLLVVSSTLFGQNSDPYKIFGHTSKVKYETKVSDFLYIKNKDTSSNTKAVAFDIQNGFVLLLDKDDKELSRVKLQPEQITKFISTDPHSDKYPSLSPYAFVANNPLNAIDPDGRDVILLVWAAGSGNSTYGHAAIAVSNYKEVSERVKVNGKWTNQTKMVADGTYSYYDLGPGNPGGMGVSNFDKDVTAAYSSRDFYYKPNSDGTYSKAAITKDVLLNNDPSTFEKGVAADGVLQLGTSFSTDQAVKTLLSNTATANQDYNGLTNNCSDFAASGLTLATGANHSIGLETIPVAPYKMHAPNTLWNDAANINTREGTNMPTTILKDPGTKTNKTMTEVIKDKYPIKSRKIIN